METTADGLFANFLKWEKGIRVNLETGLVVAMADLQHDAQDHHPYQDRSGKNTESIHGFVDEVAEDHIGGVLEATMPYSAALEKVDDGKYAYLWPAIERNAEMIMQRISGK